MKKDTSSHDTRTEAGFIQSGFEAGALSITPEELAALGGGKLAYLKPILSDDFTALFPGAPQIAPGLHLFALLAADGSPILITDSRDQALANAWEHELETVSLH